MNKTFEIKLNDIQMEKSHLERQNQAEENRQRDLYQKINELQVKTMRFFGFNRLKFIFLILLE